MLRPVTSQSNGPISSTGPWESETHGSIQIQDSRYMISYTTLTSHGRHASLITTNSNVCSTDGASSQQKNSKLLCVTLLLAISEGHPPVTGGFPSQRATNAERVSLNCWDVSYLVAWRWPRLLSWWGRCPSDLGQGRNQGKSGRPSWACDWLPVSPGEN